MLKKIGYLAITIVTIYIAYISSKFITNYGPYAVQLIKNKCMPVTEMNHPKLSLENLEQLSSIPIIGNIFQQSKLKTMIVQRKWQKILSQCQKYDQLLGKIYGQNLFIYKAIAQCATYQFVKCESTIRQIQQKIPHLYHKISHLDVKSRKQKQNRQKNQSRVEQILQF